MAEILLIVFVVCILLGMPISIALGTGALGAAMLFPALNPIIIPTRFVGLLSDSYLLLSAPLFILAGNIAARGGVARVLIDLATVLVGRFRGGLAYVNVLDSMFFGGISGSAVADVSALGTFLIPQMVRKGYDLDFATALTISTAVVAPIIPPSIIAVIYAWMADESVAAMFSAGVIPGILVGLGMAVPVFFIARKRNYPKEAPPTRAQFMAALGNALPALMIPVIIMGGILFGWFTPTEAAAVAVVYALAIPPIFYREPAWRELPQIFADSARLSGVIGMIIGFVGAFGWVLTYSKFPFTVAAAIASIAPEWWLFLLLGHRALYRARHFSHAVGDHPGHGAGAVAGGQRRGRASDPFRHGLRGGFRNRPHHAAGWALPVRRYGHQRPADGEVGAAAAAVSLSHRGSAPVPGLRPGDRPVFTPRPRFHAVDHSVNFRHIEYQVRFGGPTGKHLLAGALLVLTQAV
jgi:tripartite ATP-independent transporter DctM subunit